MPLIDFTDDDENEGVEEKFDGCAECVFFGKESPCGGCDSGEYFEERDPVGIDVLIRD